MLYDDPDDQEKLSINIGELKKAWSLLDKELIKINGYLEYRERGEGSPFDSKDDDEEANIIDLLHLFDKLVIHCSSVSDGE